MSWRSRSVGLVDQGLSSLSNVLAVFLVAGVLSADDFGRFALGYGVMVVALALSRAFFGTRLSLAATPAAAVEITRSATGALVLIAPVVAVVVFGLSMVFTRGDAAGVLAVVAVATPIVLVQDAIRYGAVSSGRPAVAVASDGLWVLIMLVPFLARWRPSGEAIMALWLLAAVAAAAVAVVGMRVRPDLRGGLAALRENHAVSRAATWAALIAVSGALLVPVIAAAIIAPSSAGAIRGASSMMGPVNVLLAFIGLALTPALVRRAREQDLRFCALTGLAVAAATAAWGVALLLLPTSAGEFLMGESWSGIRGVLPWVLLEYVLYAVSVAGGMGLRVRGMAGQIVSQRAVGTGLALTGAVIASLVVGETWAVSAAVAFSTGVMAVVVWGYLRRPVPRHAAGGPVLAQEVPS